MTVRALKQDRFAVYQDLRILHFNFTETDFDRHHFRHFASLFQACTQRI